MPRFALALALLLAPAALPAQEGSPLPPLQGEVTGNVYSSPTGAFKVVIPVLPELGGTVTDTSNVVTFQDSFSTHISIAAFPQDTTQKWKLETEGPKDYLHEFFVQYVVPDFRRSYPAVEVETSALFLPSLFEGAFVTYMVLPGGSMFANRDFQISPDARPPVAKRGNLIFVRYQMIYVISTELAERAIEGTAYHRTSAEEDLLLRDRLRDIANKIQFTKPVAPKK